MEWSESRSPGRIAGRVFDILCCRQRASWRLSQSRCACGSSKARCPAPSESWRLSGCRLLQTREAFLTSLPQGQWTLYDRVEPQQVIAQFDDRALRAQMATLAEDLTRLQKELDAAGAKLTVSEADRSRAAWDDATRLSFELEQHRLVALQKRLQLEVNRLKAEQANTALECMKPLAEKKMVSALEMNNARMLREETAKQAAEDQKVLAEAETQQKQAAERLRTLPALVPADVARELAAIAAAASVQKARIHGACKSRLTILRAHADSGDDLRHLSLAQ